MKQSKKISRQQRNLLLRKGYKGDVNSVRFLVEDKEKMVFVEEDGTNVIYDKHDNKLII